MFTRSAWHAGRALSLSTAERFVLLYLTDRARRDGTWADTQEEIAAFTGLGARTVRRALSNLVTLGLIDVVARGHRTGESASASSYCVLLQPATVAGRDASTGHSGRLSESPTGHRGRPNRPLWPAQPATVAAFLVPRSDPRSDPPEGDARAPEQDDEGGRGGVRPRSRDQPRAGGVQSSAPLVQSPLRSLHTCARCGRQWRIHFGNVCQRCHLQVGDQPPPARDPNADPF